MCHSSLCPAFSSGRPVCLADRAPKYFLGPSCAVNLRWLCKRTAGVLTWLLQSYIFLVSDCTCTDSTCTVVTRQCGWYTAAARSSLDEGRNKQRAPIDDPVSISQLDTLCGWRRRRVYVTRVYTLLGQPIRQRPQPPSWDPNI